MVDFWKYLIPKDVNAMLKLILVTTGNGKPQTPSSRLPFAGNAMLKVSNYIPVTQSHIDYFQLLELLYIHS